MFWGRDGIEGRPIEVSRPHARRVKGIILHRLAAGDRPETAVIERIPVTEIRRTIVDLAAVLPPSRLALALDSALRRGLITLPRLMQMIESQAGRTGLASLRRIIKQRDERDTRAESRLESDVLALLRARRFPLPLTQYRVEADGEVVARLDFAYPEFRLGIEADGYRWHAGRERWAQDMRRENRLKLLGWTLLRFSWEDVHERPETVAEQVQMALAPYLVQFPSLSDGNCTGFELSGGQGVS
jgi:very-short-patch-repair endonuclease